MALGITVHPSWPLLRPWIVIERYGRDTGPRGARWRIEVRRPTDGRILRQLLGITMPCVACGYTIHPVRERQGQDRLYLAATCPLELRFGCARGAAARAEYLAVRQAIDTRPPEPPAARLPFE